MYCLVGRLKLNNYLFYMRERCYKGKAVCYKHLTEISNLAGGSEEFSKEGVV